MHEGHRQRMFAHLKRGAGNLEDHELLELLLFFAIPRKNTNPIAHMLISAFGSLEGVFRADHDQYLAIEGIGESTAAYLSALSGLIGRLGRADAKYSLPVVGNVHAFVDFLGSRFDGSTEESLEVYCLDEQHRVFFTKHFTTFQSDKVTIAPDELNEIVTLQHPHSIVVAHNHPLTSARPSAADDVFTAQLSLLCFAHGISLEDHIIVGENETYSYFLSGRLSAIRQNCKDSFVGEEEP